MGKLLMGDSIAQKLNELTHNEVNEIKLKTRIEPGMAIITTEDGGLLKKSEFILHADFATHLGVNVRKFMLPKNAKENQILDIIQQCNRDKNIHAILPLLPLPDHIDQAKVISTIVEEKEIEGLREKKDISNLFEGKHISVLSSLLIMMKSIDYDIFAKKNVFLVEDDTLRKNAVVIRLLELISNLKIYIEAVTSKDENFEEITSKADLLMVSMRTPEFIDEKYIKKDAVVIDFTPVTVGEKFSEKRGRIIPILKSSLKVESVLHKAKYVAPHLGGIGPITLAVLMRNFVYSYKCLAQMEVK